MSCCLPDHGREHEARPQVRCVPAQADGPDDTDMVLVPAGVFRMGCDRREGAPGDGEWPARPVQLAAFRMDRCAVSNRRFARFVAQTGYVTDAEQQGWSFVFAGLLPDDFPPTRGVASAPWWRQVEGACWRHPQGLHSDLTLAMDAPVVHVSHHDALAFCAWAGKQLPTEAQWERAARGGHEGRRFPWGDEDLPEGEPRCNVWQGVFPSRNDRVDGHYGLAPVDAFAPNDYGLHNMVGNCWEWCADWFEPDWAAQQLATGQSIIDPTGPREGDHRVLRGGSFLCHPSYCGRYRNASRSASTPDSTTGHIGFRCVLA